MKRELPRLRNVRQFSTISIRMRVLKESTDLSDSHTEIRAVQIRTRIRSILRITDLIRWMTDSLPGRAGRKKGLIRI